MSDPYTSILKALPEKFNKAKTSGELLFFESESKTIDSEGKQFEVKICPALLNKGKAKEEAKPTSAERKDTPPPPKKEKSSPFEPPYIEDLHVGTLEGFEGEEGMAVLLNKYSVLPHHFLLTSLTHKPQSLPPTPHQLLLAYNLLLSAAQPSTSASTPQQGLLAFYNGGTGAGASQAWRHIQLIPTTVTSPPPVESWLTQTSTKGLDTTKPFLLSSVPYLHILHSLNLPIPSPARRKQETLPWPPTEESDERVLMTLAKALMGSLDLMFDTLRRRKILGLEGGEESGGWNLLLTLTHLHLIPRSNPSYPLQPTSTNPSKLDKLEINALGYAGMLLVKSPEQLDALEKITFISTSASSSTAEESNGTGTGFMKVLEHCGVPREWAEEFESGAKVVEGQGGEMMAGL